MSGIFGIAITGLRAAQVGLSTAGHNISNASTEGYHRQEIVQSTNTPIYTGSGFLGQGTNVDTVKRIYSQFLDRQVQTAQTQSTYLETYSAQIGQIDNMLADPKSGLSPALQQFFQGVHDVAANPTSVPSRQSMISSSEALVTRFQTLNQRFVEIREGVDTQIVASVGIINAYARQIAELNNRIVLAEAGGNGQPPNDILDQRDRLVADINKEINVSVVKQTDGAYNIFMGQGQALVVGQQAYTLSAKPSPDDPERMDVAYVSNGRDLFLPPGSLDGGNLGGLLGFRADSLDAAQNGLGLVAIGLAQTFNDQHKLGQDLNGDLGTSFFNVRGPGAYAGPFAVPSAKVVANTKNSDMTVNGLPAVTLSDVSKVTASDYKLSYSAAGYSLSRLSDNAVLFSGVASLSALSPVDGLTFTDPVTAPANADSWLIQPTRDGAKDFSVAIHDTAKIAAAAPILASPAFINDPVKGTVFTNTGTGRISAGSVDANFLAAPPALPVTLTYDATANEFSGFPGNVTVTLSDGTSTLYSGVPVPYTEGATITFDGISFTVTGQPATGDSFTVSPNISGVADNRNALLLAGLQTKNTLAGSTASYQSIYSQIVSSIGVKSRDINVTAQAQASLVSQSQQAQQALSGVNLDEEAANLLRYQQAYQASGKMMQIASTLFDTLLSLGN